MIAMLVAILIACTRIIRVALAVCYGVAAAFVSIVGTPTLTFRRWLVVARGCIPPPRVAIVSLLLVAGCAAGIARADITTGLVLRLKLNEPSGTACVDSTGLHADGTYAGTWSTTAAPAQFGASEVARVGDGATNDVTIADANDVESTANMTIARWKKTTTTSSVFDYTKSNAAFTSGHEAGDNSGSHAFVGRPVGVNIAPLSPDYNDGNWHHVVITSTDVGGGNVVIRCYTDGVLVFTSSSIAWTPATNSDPVRVFSRRGALWFPGAMYDLRHYNRALSGADVAELFRFPPVPILQRMQLNMSSLQRSPWDRFVAQTPISLAN